MIAGLSLTPRSPTQLPPALAGLPNWRRHHFPSEQEGRKVEISKRALPVKKKSILPPSVIPGTGFPGTQGKNFPPREAPHERWAIRKAQVPQGF